MRWLTALIFLILIWILVNQIPDTYQGLRMFPNIQMSDFKAMSKVGIALMALLLIVPAFKSIKNRFKD